jgi:hypothetical protein
MLFILAPDELVNLSIEAVVVSSPSISTFNPLGQRFLACYC